MERYASQGHAEDDLSGQQWQWPSTNGGYSHPSGKQYNDSTSDSDYRAFVLYYPDEQIYSDPLSESDLSKRVSTYSWDVVEIFDIDNDPEMTVPIHTFPYRKVDHRDGQRTRQGHDKKHHRHGKKSSSQDDGSGSAWQYSRTTGQVASTVLASGGRIANDGYTHDRATMVVENEDYYELEDLPSDHELRIITGYHFRRQTAVARSTAFGATNGFPSTVQGHVFGVQSTVLEFPLVADSGTYRGGYPGAARTYYGATDPTADTLVYIVSEEEGAVAVGRGRRFRIQQLSENAHSVNLTELVEQGAEVSAVDIRGRKAAVYHPGSFSVLR